MRFLFLANSRFLLNIGQTLYYGANYPRLKRLKDQYDPVDTLNFPTAIEEWPDYTNPLDIWCLLTEYEIYYLILDISTIFTVSSWMFIGVRSNNYDGSDT